MNQLVKKKKKDKKKFELTKQLCLAKIRKVLLPLLLHFPQQHACYIFQPGEKARLYYRRVQKNNQTERKRYLPTSKSKLLIQRGMKVQVKDRSLQDFKITLFLQALGCCYHCCPLLNQHSAKLSLVSDLKFLDLKIQDCTIVDLFLISFKLTDCKYLLGTQRVYNPSYS